MPHNKLHTAVKSSNVESYHYDHQACDLHVKFKTGSKIYIYTGVPKHAVDELLAAPSFGSHLAKHIVPKFKVKA